MTVLENLEMGAFIRQSNGAIKEELRRCSLCFLILKIGETKGLQVGLCAFA